MLTFIMKFKRTGPVTLEPNQIWSCQYFCQFQVVCITEWSGQRSTRLQVSSDFQTEVREREPNMADNVAETLDKMNLGDSKDVRYI